jgi:hypothetical protein
MSSRRSFRGTFLAIAAVVAISVTGLGVAAGLGSQILLGGGETGQGSDVTQHALAYWTWTSTVSGTIPTPVPVAISHTVTAPTRLPRFAGTSYALNAATAGQASVVWTFSEATTAPRSTELVLTFVEGVGATTTTILAYVETSARVPLAALSFVIYWDAGTSLPTGFAISSLTATVQACTGIGVCP